MTPIKKPWKSKQIWSNIVVIIAVALQMYTGHEVLTLDRQILLVAVMNIFWRFVTTSPIAWTKKGAYLRLANLIDQFRFEWRDTKKSQTILWNWVRKNVK
jgi:hypothetical protein